MGYDVSRFVSHVPNLPVEIWGDLTGLRDLQSAYSSFEGRVTVRASAFIGEIVSGRRRLEPPIVRSQKPRADKRRIGSVTRAPAGFIH